MTIHCNLQTGQRCPEGGSYIERPHFAKVIHRLPTAASDYSAARPRQTSVVAMRFSFTRRAFSLQVLSLRRPDSRPAVLLRHSLCEWFWGIRTARPFLPSFLHYVINLHVYLFSFRFFSFFLLFPSIVFIPLLWFISFILTSSLYIRLHL